ncbi:hypothetical protein CspHIS471_0502420 [Cutaneotrichosporon sp. HIS471]|nr:hypothetical protein CspHIS471_0502420 [Cutaneotrichosporon sp. HIS471]
MDEDQWRFYLSANLQTDDFTITRLTGGFVNSTIRVTLHNQPTLPSSHPLHEALATMSSFVLKHAAPYIHADPSNPVPVFRQTIEARALSHLATPPLSSILKETNVAVPKLVWHDNSAHVLWMSDMGALPTLTNYFEGVPSWSPEEIGGRLGHALASLHSICRNPSPTLIQQFTYPDNNPFLESIAERARKAMHNTGHMDATILSHRLGLWHNLEEAVWGMGDLWPGAVLLPLKSEDPLVLVDWEFACVLNPGAEVGMLLSHIAMHNVAGREGCDAFADAFIASYTAVWGGITRAFVREAMCAYGREMVTWYDYHGENYKDLLMEEGVAALRVVGDSVTDMGELGPTARYMYLAPFVSMIK